jgi:hypothetical protein
VELATFGFNTRCLTLEAESPRESNPPHFIAVSRRGGVTRVTCAVATQFGLESGAMKGWQRLRIANVELFCDTTTEHDLRR